MLVESPDHEYAMLRHLTFPMQGETKERWLELCEQAAVEQAPQRLMALLKEICELLEEKERKLGIIPPVLPRHPAS
jgi:truncated hemoglobin YjbI